MNVPASLCISTPSAAIMVLALSPSSLSFAASMDCNTSLTNLSSSRASGSVSIRFGRSQFLTLLLSLSKYPCWCGLVVWVKAPQPLHIRGSFRDGAPCSGDTEGSADSNDSGTSEDPGKGALCEVAVVMSVWFNRL